MRKINFTKMVAAGNDFVVIESGYPVIRLSGYPALARSICDRKYGIGADGLLVLEKSKVADVKMRIFNADGSEAQMCGNGARCVALFKSQVTSHKSQVKIETRAGIIESEAKGDNIRIQLTGPKNLKLDIPIRVNNRQIRVSFINTGVPHAVIFVEGLEKIDVINLGRMIRFHKQFSPRGTNVDFVEVLSNNSIRVRTYERGVEDETLACGTGAVAAALITTYNLRLTTDKINVYTQSGEILKVYFTRMGNTFKNVWLEGKVTIVHKGVICI